MTNSSRQLNFSSPQRKLNALRAATGVVLSLCAVMLWVVIWGPTPAHRSTATIADQLGATASASGSPAPVAIPKAVSTGGAGSVALGIEPDTVRYYEPTTGRAFAVDMKTGKVQVLSDRKLSGFIHSWWVPGANQVVSSFDQNGTVEYRNFDYATGAAKVVGTAVASLALSPDGRRVVFADNEGEGLGIFTAAIDGTEPRRILATRTADIQVSWPSKDLLALSTRRPDRAGRDMTLLRMDGTLDPIISNRENLEYAWSRDGSKLLFSYFLPGKGISLWYRDIAQGTDTRLELPTSARKCAWHSDNLTITCGVPTQSSLSGDVPTDRVASTDNIVTLDLRSGESQTLYTAKTGVLLGVIDPIISSSGRYITFPNVFDQRLFVFGI